MAASLVFAVCLFVIALNPHGSGLDSVSSLFFAFWFWLTGGFILALLLLIIPWSLSVLIYRKFRWSGRIFFPVIGALLLFLLGSATSPFGWSPLFVGDQTYLQSALIAAQRQGIAFLLSGLTFGIVYWFFGERPLSAQPQPQSSPSISPV